MALSRSPAPLRQDVPPVLALLGFGLVVGALFFFESPTTFHLLYQGIDRYLEAHAEFVSAAIFSAAVNLIWMYSLVARAIGLQKQGSRLEILTGRKSETQGTSYRGIVGAAMSGAAIYFALYLLDYPAPQELSPLILSPAIVNKTLIGLRLNFAGTAFVLGFILSRSALWNRLLDFRGRGLSAMPAPKNGIVLGSTGDDSPGEKADWAVLNRRALNGNILITGSIGGGKTQGTILPYLDQILGNFRPRPSILAIDPKGTFIPAALRIIEKHGLSEHVLHMKLGGNVTFNPIFHSEPLKGAHFLDTAQMIRAAAVNFMGRSFDSPFWEISAFNLIKNCLVLCGAKYREV